MGTSYEQAKEIAKEALWSFRHYDELRLEGGTQCDFELEEVDYVEDETGYLYHHIAVYGLSKEDFKHFAKWFFGAINMLNNKAKKRDEINYDNDDYDDEEEITLTDEEFKLVDEAADRAFLEWNREMELKEEEKRKKEEEKRKRAEEEKKKVLEWAESRDDLRGMSFEELRFMMEHEKWEKIIAKRVNSLPDPWNIACDLEIHYPLILGRPGISSVLAKKLNDR